MVLSHELVVVGLVHDIGALLVFHTVDGTGDAVHIGLGDEVLTVAGRQLLPIPPRDDIIQLVTVALVVHPDLVDRLAVGIVDRADLHRIIAIRHLIGIEVRLHIEQLQLTVRGCRDGERQVYLLRVGRSRTRIGRHLLVVDIDLTLHVPVVGLGIVRRTDDIGIVRGIAIVDNALRRMDKVTGGLPFHGLIDV